MSAFIVNDIHIDALVNLALAPPAGFARIPGGPYALRFDFHDNRGDGEVRLDRANDLGQMLRNANLRSIKDRYPESEEDYWPYHYKRPPRQLTALEGLKALACYEYQTCESDSWDGSLAWMFCEALRRHLIHFIPGYDEGPWEIAPGFYGESEA